jgi:NADPH:quinone reductase
LADAQKLMPRVDPRRFSLATAGDAYQAVEDRTAAGKIVVDVGG